MEEFDDLRSRDLTDWFIHEARNALATHNNIDGVTWDRLDYESGRDQLKRVLDSFDRFSTDGVLSRDKIRKFVRNSTKREWNEENIGKIWEQFKLLIDESESK